MATPCPWGVGAKTKTVLFFEGSTYGELPTTPVGHIMPINENTVKSSQNSSDVATITGDRNPVEPIYGNNDLGGDITAPVDYVAMGYWLKACFDDPTSTALITVIDRYNLTATAVADGYTVDAEGLHHNTDPVVSWADVETGWTSTYSTHFETNASGTVYRYTVISTSATYACYGAPNVPAKKHVFKIGSGMPSFTLEKQFPGITQYFKQSGCKISKLSLNFGGDGELTATISILGKAESVSGTAISGTVTNPTFNRALNFQASLKVGGTAVAIGKSFTLDIDFGLDADTYCIGGNGYRSAVCDGLVKVSGSAEMFFKDDTFIALAENSTETSMELTLTHGTTEKMTIKLPEVKFARTGVDISGPTGVVQSLSYNAYYKDSTEQSAVVFELENGQASYTD